MKTILGRVTTPVQVSAVYKTLPNVTGFSKDGDGGLMTGKKWGNFSNFFVCKHHNFFPKNGTKCDSFCKIRRRTGKKGSYKQHLSLPVVGK